MDARNRSPCSSARSVKVEMNRTVGGMVYANARHRGHGPPSTCRLKSVLDFWRGAVAGRHLFKQDVGWGKESPNGSLEPSGCVD